MITKSSYCVEGKFKTLSIYEIDIPKAPPIKQKFHGLSLINSD